MFLIETVVTENLPISHIYDVCRQVGVTIERVETNRTLYTGKMLRISRNKLYPIFSRKTISTFLKVHQSINGSIADGDTYYDIKGAEAHLRYNC